MACASVPPEAPPAVSEPATSPQTERSAPPTHRSPFKEPPGAFYRRNTSQRSSDDLLARVDRHRPSVPSFTQGLKKVMLTRAGLPPGVKYELDHFVPLAVGGHPRSEDNLWLQRWDGAWNARVKDRLERRLQLMVCAGDISLHAAGPRSRATGTLVIASTWRQNPRPCRETWSQPKRKASNSSQTAVGSRHPITMP